jgi:hypothetical protein
MKKGKLKISQAFQRGLLVLVVVAFLTTQKGLPQDTAADPFPIYTSDALTEKHCIFSTDMVK